MIKLIVIWKEGKQYISNYWIIWRDEIFVFGCGRLMVLDKMGQFVLKDRVLQDAFQIVFQTFLVTVADLFGVGHFVLCSSFSFFEKTNLQLSWSCVLVSLATENVD